MLEIYWTKNSNVHRKTEIILERKLGKDFTIKRTPNGKPYIDGNPLYFSISHSVGHAVIAVCDRPVGIDIEYYDKEGRTKNYSHIISRMTEREKSWLNQAFVYFFINWVAKEAYIKMNGWTLARDLKRLEYCDYKLYCDGEEVNCGYAVMAELTDGPYAVCAEGHTREEIAHCPVRLFRLKKGERIR